MSLDMPELPENLLKALRAIDEHAGEHAPTIKADLIEGYAFSMAIRAGIAPLLQEGKQPKNAIFALFATAIDTARGAGCDMEQTVAMFGEALATVAGVTVRVDLNVVQSEDGADDEDPAPPITVPGAASGSTH